MKRDDGWSTIKSSLGQTYRGSEGSLLCQCVDFWVIMEWVMEIMEAFPLSNENENVFQAREVFLRKARKDLPLKRPKYSGDYYHKKNILKNIYGHTMTGFCVNSVRDLMFGRPPKVVISENFERQRQANVVAAINRILRYRHQSWYIRLTLGSDEIGLDPQAHPLQLKWNPTVSARELVAKDLIMEKLGEDIFQSKLKATVNDIIKGKDLSYGSNVPHTTAILIVQHPELESQLGDILAIDGV